MPTLCTEKHKIERIGSTVENLEKSLDEFKTDTKEDLKTLHQKMDNFIESSNKTYATKKELYFLIPLCGLAVIGLMVINKLI